jgi:hypothetical protein
VLLAAADAALYQAKRSDRNQVEAAEAAAVAGELAAQDRWAPGRERASGARPEQSRANKAIPRNSTLWSGLSAFAR